MGKGLPKSHKRGKFSGHDVPTDFLGGAGGIDWSTSETDTGLLWIDGKPIYQKTVQVAGTLTGGAVNSTPHGISDLKRVVQLYGGAEDGGAGAAKQFFPVPFASPSANIGWQVQLTDTNIAVFLGTYWNRSSAATSINNMILTVRYTKTTD